MGKDEKEQKSSMCSHLAGLNFMSKLKITADDVINACDSALEGDNRHSESASKVWESIKRYIEPRNRLRAAKALGDGMDCDWEGNLQYVTNFDDEDET